MRRSDRQKHVSFRVVCQCHSGLVPESLALVFLDEMPESLPADEGI